MNALQKLTTQEDQGQNTVNRLNQQCNRMYVKGGQRLSVRWEYEAIVYCELLTRNKAINSDVYCER